MEIPLNHYEIPYIGHVPQMSLKLRPRRHVAQACASRTGAWAKGLTRRQQETEDSDKWEWELNNVLNGIT